MSWLYEHRGQLDGLRPLVEMAYKVTYGIPRSDQDDVEQDVVIELIKVSKAGKTYLKYLRQAAYHKVAHYWHKFRLEAKRFITSREAAKARLLLMRR